MGEANPGVFGLDQREVTGFAFAILLTPVSDGEPVQVEAEVRVCCETADADYDFRRIVHLTEVEFPSFLNDCLRLVEALHQLVKQNSEES